LTDNSPDQSILSDEALLMEITSQIKSAPSKTKEKSKVSAAKVELDRIIFQASNIERRYETEPVTKKMKLGDLPSLEARQANAYIFYESLKIEGLKDVLRWNHQPVGGTKPELLIRIIEGHVHGRLAPCTVCGEGKLRPLDTDSSKIICKGYFDKKLNAHIPCDVMVDTESAPRFIPWYKSKPNKEEEKIMDEEYEAAIGLAESTETDKVLHNSSLLRAVQEMQWNTSSSAGIKAAAAGLTELCCGESSPLDFPPKLKARRVIGKLILDHKTSSAEEILNIVALEFGFKAQKEAKAKEKSEAMKSTCLCPANAKIVEVLKELGDYYFKEGNANAGGTYKKVIAAVSKLPFEITLDNAKGLGKGKSKVVNVGKGSAEKMHEFLETGTIGKLEEKREIHKVS